MTDQPPAQPTEQHPAQPTGQPPAQPPKANAWRQATSTSGGRWAIGVAAGALALLMLLGIGAAGLLVFRTHDRLDMSGQMQGYHHRDQGGQGRDRGPDTRDGDRPRNPGMPGAPGQDGGKGDARAGGLGGLGGLLGGTALHGTVTTTVNGAVQAVLFQRGEVTAVSATSITLKSSDGFAATYGRTAATTSVRAAPVKGGQALVLARASDKVATTVVSTPARAGAAPTS